MQIDAEERERLYKAFPKGSTIVVTEGSLKGFHGTVKGIDINGCVHADIEGKEVVLSAAEGDNIKNITKERLPERDCYSFERELNEEGMELSILNRNTNKKDTIRLDDDSLLLDVEKDIEKNTENGMENNLDYDFLEQELKRHIKAAVYQDLVNSRFTYPECDKGQLELNIEEFSDTIYRDHFKSKIHDFTINLEKAHSRSQTKNNIRAAQKTPGKVYRGVVRNCDRHGFVTEHGGLSVQHKFSDIAESSWKNIYNGKQVKVIYCKRAHMLDKAARAETWELGQELDTGRELFKINKKEK